MSSTAASVPLRDRPVGEAIFLAVLIGIALLGLIFRLRMFAMNRSLWLDPAMLALNLVEKGYPELLGRLEWNQAAPFGFLLGAKLVGSMFGYSERGLYLLPFVAGVGALVLFLVLAVEALGRRLAPIAVAPLAFSSTAVYYSAELKQYSLDLFCAVLILFAAHRVVRRNLAGRWIALWAVSAMVAVWLSHPSIFVAAGTGLALLVIARVRSSWALPVMAVAVLTVAAHFVVVYVFITRASAQPDLYAYHSGAYAPLWPLARETGAWWLQQVVGYGRFPLGFGEWAVIPLMLLAVGAFGAAIERATRELAALVSVPLVVAMAASALHLYPLGTGVHDVNARFVLFTLPSVCLLIALGARYLSCRTPRPAITLVVLTGLVATPPLVRMLDGPAYIRQEMRPLVRHLAERVEPGEAVYVFNPAVPAFRFYIREAPIAFTAGAPIPDAADLPPDVARALDGGAGWVVIAHDHIGARDALVRELDQHGWSHERTSFPGATLIRVEPPPGG